MSKLARVEVIQTGSRRRWTLEEKQRIVAESESDARQVSATARRHGLSPAQLFGWRRLAREGRLGGRGLTTFAQAVLASEPAAEDAGSRSVARNWVEIVLRDGLRVAVDQAVDPGALARIVGALERR